MSKAAVPSASSPAADRERGTPKHSLLRRPIAVIGLVGLVSATLATQLSLYSLPGSQGALFGIAGLGSACTLVGVVLEDPFSQSFVSALALILVGFTCGDANASLRAASAPLGLAVLASINPVRMTFSSLDSFVILLEIVLPAIFTLQSLALLFQAILSSQSTTQQFAILPSLTVAIVTLLLMRSYLQNRSHKNGCLLTSERKSQSLVASLSLILSAHKFGQTFPFETTVMLLGSLLTILLSLYFASIADVWYAVGSGQFQMVSLDSAGMMLYFLLPTGMLGLRFLHLYGTSIQDLVTQSIHRLALLLGIGLSQKNDNYPNTLLLLLSTVIALGVPLLNATCPLGGYLCSRAYVHGQPNTKKVAICVDFLKTLANEQTEICQYFLKQQRQENTTSTTTTTPIAFNIVVTLEDMQSFPKELMKLAEWGHHIVVSSSKKRTLSGSLWDLSLFQGKRARDNIETAFHEYCSLFSDKRPNWFMSQSTDTLGRHPSMLRKANDLEMKVAYWSTRIQVLGGTLLKQQLKTLVSDVMDKNGGSIIRVDFGNDASDDCVSTSLLAIMHALKDYSLLSLSEVAKDDAAMVL